MTHKLQIKIGQAEFLAEGEKEAVQEQFNQFLEAIANSKSAEVTKPPEAPLVKNGNQLPQIDRETLDRVFLVDDQSLISLRIKPATEQRDADGLLLLLYGYRVLQGQSDVLSLRLKTSAIQSGINVVKPSITLAVHKQFVTAGGDRRSATYGLNNPGMLKAEEIIRGMLG